VKSDSDSDWWTATDSLLPPGARHHWPPVVAIYGDVSSVSSFAGSAEVPGSAENLWGIDIPGASRMQDLSERAKNQFCH
jgi:hypothetical protein